ncbi:hypothetical protein I3843_09G156300 [Carya illinoinensis]|uniref:Uncharacterized protein n=1 Tax=Carya illinoinensis TaxID=32201 RepID=A0A922E556_CARIL|nr:hypothetical protein I3842_09G161500 [Carya illinoinensis]KAG7964183.1 hypothetical protein I3843_09G156300 [Carya illinoinensis]
MCICGKLLAEGPCTLRISRDLVLGHLVPLKKKKKISVIWFIYSLSIYPCLLNYPRGPYTAAAGMMVVSLLHQILFSSTLILEVFVLTQYPFLLSSIPSSVPLSLSLLH